MSDNNQESMSPETEKAIKVVLFRIPSNRNRFENSVKDVDIAKKLNDMQKETKERTQKDIKYDPTHIDLTSGISELGVYKVKLIGKKFQGQSEIVVIVAQNADQANQFWKAHIKQQSHK